MKRMVWAAFAICSWMLLALFLLAIPLGVFIAPRMVAQVKAQGGTELPVAWQVMVDLGDLSINRGLVVFPILISTGIFASLQAAKKR